MPSGRLLIVDDEESVLVTMQAILQLDGYEVATASKGAVAIERLREQVFDLVLTDLRLEDADGLSILAEVRRQSPDTVTIMLTGYASLDSAVKALREGAYDYLTKPCDVEELKATVARGIERRQLALQLRERITELEEANETIRVMNTDLHRRIDAATAELRRRMDELAKARDELVGLYEAAQRHVEELRELDRLKSQFLSMASHELKTPLTSMSGFLQVTLRRIRRRLESGHPASEEWEREQRMVLDQLEVVSRQTGRLARLVNELLDVSRIETGRIEFSFGPVDVTDLATEVVGRMQLTTNRHQIELLPAPDSRVVVSADRDHLEQVLNNLIGNAVKYSPEGGVVTVGIEPEGGEVLISVRDRGIGIASGELDKIFGLFYRSEERTSRDIGGMGLGLYISKEIIGRHGGRIWAESELGEGSTFYISLPRLAEAPVAATAAGQRR
ncbi:MAG TPA: ATP-binding protein [Chloroflexota bacterium]|jgi:signal transduction histidine kinase|nr:ATP-binding protein [Chloroflexota bacterium]